MVSNNPAFIGNSGNSNYGENPLYKSKEEQNEHSAISEPPYSNEQLVKSSIQKEPQSIQKGFKGLSKHCTQLFTKPFQKTTDKALQQMGSSNEKSVETSQKKRHLSFKTLKNSKAIVYIKNKVGNLPSVKQVLKGFQTEKNIPKTATQTANPVRPFTPIEMNKVNVEKGKELAYKIVNQFIENSEEDFQKAVENLYQEGSQEALASYIADIVATTPEESLSFDMKKQLFRSLLEKDTQNVSDKNTFLRANTLSTKLLMSISKQSLGISKEKPLENGFSQKLAEGFSKNHTEKKKLADAFEAIKKDVAHDNGWKKTAVTQEEKKIFKAQLKQSIEFVVEQLTEDSLPTPLKELFSEMHGVFQSKGLDADQMLVENFYLRLVCPQLILIARDSTKNCGDLISAVIQKIVNDASFSKEPHLAFMDNPLGDLTFKQEMQNLMKSGLQFLYSKPPSQQ